MTGSRTALGVEGAAGIGQGLRLDDLKGGGLCAGASERGWLQPSLTGFEDGGQAGGASWRGLWKGQELKFKGAEQGCRGSA